MSSPRLDPPRFHGRWYHLRALRRAFEREAASWKNAGLLVDLGCGDMPYRPIFAPKVRRYVGADLERNRLADLHFDAAGRVPLPEATADIVLSSQVLEHVRSPQDYLREAHRLLKPAGVLLLSTHGYWRYHPDPTDFWRWTRDGLVVEIERAGFEVVSVSGVMNLAASGLQLLQDGVRRAIPKPLRPPFFFLMNRAMALVDRIGGDDARDRDASVFVVHARKAMR